LTAKPATIMSPPPTMFTPPLTPGHSPHPDETPYDDALLFTLQQAGVMSLTSVAATLRRDCVSVSLLPQLTEADLTKMSVPLGDRKRILAYAAANKETLKGVGEKVNLSATPVRRRDGVHSVNNELATSDGLNAHGFREVVLGELTLETKIGAGAFGQVFRGRYRGAVVAVKQLKFRLLDEEDVAAFRMEAALLQRLNHHPHIIKFIGASETASYIVTEFAPHGSVKDLLARDSLMPVDKRIEWLVFVRIARDAAAGLLHLHRENVIHRDVAARNILVGINYTAYVSDLGLARLAAGSKGYTMSTTGPLRHMAPEAILNRQYSSKSDSYSFGVFLWELTHRGEPYNSWTPYRIQQHVVAGGRPPIDDQAMPSQPTPCPPSLVSLMHACWAPDPSHRPDLSHVYAALNTYYTELKRQAVDNAATSSSSTLSQPRSGLLMSTDALFADGPSGEPLSGEYYYVDEEDIATAIHQ